MLYHERKKNDNYYAGKQFLAKTLNKHSSLLSSTRTKFSRPSFLKAIMMLMCTSFYCFLLFNIEASILFPCNFGPNLFCWTVPVQQTRVFYTKTTAGLFRTVISKNINSVSSTRTTVVLQQGNVQQKKKCLLTLPLSRYRRRTALVE